MTLEEYYAAHGSKITQESERLFVDEFLYPLVGDRIGAILPQHPFLDRTGRSRRIDFAYQGSRAPLALEVNGETYHAEGIIPNEMFDDNLFRQNEILRAGYRLVRFSYSQLKDPKWRPVIMASLRDVISDAAPELLTAFSLKPNAIQLEALGALDFYRGVKGWRKGIVVMPTGTGKTILSAMDAQRVGGKVLFVVHRLDILAQSVEAYRFAWPTMKHGYLTGEARYNELDADVLFASKDTLRQTAELLRFEPDHFSYVVIDEVHHGQSPSYRDILDYFTPQFMLGMTATPDRLDRKDIFDLFDYNKAYEIPLAEVIDRGELVPYTYYGLTDDVDYSKIRYANNRYNVADLEKLLIIPERNEAILKAYREKGGEDKAIGFCASIKHAERMAAFFNANGINAAAIHSQAPQRDQLVQDFRNDKITVAFTVDLFNEGVDFPNVQVLLFLRPTESKTVFVQQMGRGLRLCAGKDRVRILDFIGNYKRVNLIRGYLAKGQHEITTNEGGKTKRKVEYEYSTGCEVHFDETVQEILDRQDAEALGIGKLELTEAYYALSEKLGRKPTRAEVDEHGEYKSALYAKVFGSWIAFLREINEYTEASYHYPQGTHLGHILAILWYFGLPSRVGTPFDNEYIRFRGQLGEGRVSTYRRQLKYKLQAAMELGLLEDDRRAPPGNEFFPSLTPLGHELRAAMLPVLERLDLSFPLDDDGLPSTSMNEDEEVYSTQMRGCVEAGGKTAHLIRKTFLRMSAVQQMLSFIFHVARSAKIEKSFIYENFFKSPAVRAFQDREGIDEATIEAARRRCPFLLHVLSALRILRTERSSIIVAKLAVSHLQVQPFQREEEEISRARLAAFKKAWPNSPQYLPGEDLSILRELFGTAILTPEYTWTTAEFFEDI